jgi:hypothetical protein
MAHEPRRTTSEVQKTGLLRVVSGELLVSSEGSLSLSDSGIYGVLLALYTANMAPPDLSGKEACLE